MSDSESPPATPGPGSGHGHGHGQGAKAAGAVRSRGIGGLARGVFAAAHGAGMALGNRDVRRVYFKFTLVLVVLSVALFAALGYAIWHLTQPESAGGWVAGMAGDFLAVLVRVAGLIITALVSPLLAFLLVGLLIPVFSETLFLAGLRALDAPRAQALADRPGLSIAASLWKTVRLLAHLLVFTIVAFAVSFVPFAGVVLGPAIQLWGTGKILGWELLDPFFDKQRMAFAAQKVYVRQHAAAVVGFGVAWSFVLALPLLGALFFGLAQASAPLLLVRVLEPSPQLAPASAR
jgi:CysZ protein